ncbi:hypothetical protein HMPREF0103_1720 [Bacteroides sp. 2_1_33B]|nr:hypothetical protein HMPREF0103_1720 [Bacteroides sp. 2_1_33B]
MSAKSHLKEIGYPKNKPYVCSKIKHDMKRLIIKKACAIIFICILCASYFFLKEEKQNFTDLTFSNIEALASGESGSGACFGAGSLSCNGGYYEYKFYSLK